MPTLKKSMNHISLSRPALLGRESNQPRWLLAWIFTAFLVSAGTSLGQEFGRGAVLLKETDRVLIGQILQRSNFYEIELAPNSRVSIPTDKVAHVAGSLQELYQFKRSNMSPTNIGDHFVHRHGIEAFLSQHQIDLPNDRVFTCQQHLGFK